MEELQILGKVTYKQIVTDGYKQRTAAEIQKQIDEIDSQLADFDKQMSKTMTELTLKAHPQTEAIRAQLNAERDKINVYGEGDFLTTIKVGDPFTAGTHYELVIEDDVVKEIRQK